jgi:hypothetical protein
MKATIPALFAGLLAIAVYLVSTMGFFFRKSVRLGPLRLNLSKSGLGASIGVKGARLTASSRGSTYITLGSHGFFYRQAIGRHERAGSIVPPPPPFQVHEAPPADPGTIPTASISELVESSNADLIQQLNERAQKTDPAIVAWILCLAPITLAISTGQDWWYALLVVPVVLASVLHRMYKDQTTTRLCYELPESETANFAVVQQAIAHLSQSHRIWRIIHQVATSQQKYHAGATSLINRTSVHAGILQIPRVTTNLPIAGIDMGAIKMFLLPDMILYLEGKTFANIPYEALGVRSGTTRFIEDDTVPRDARVVGKTWRYVNKSGGPDRRFNNNRQLSIAEYGVLELTSASGLNIHLNTSSAEKATAFANCMAERLGRTRPRRTTAPPPPPPPPPPPQGLGSRAKALKVLGLTESPSPEVLSAAYHRLAQMYHPDKVAGLAPEFQVLADQRMKEINAAYAFLRG